jgi:hypothetical protein
VIWTTPNKHIEEISNGEDMYYKYSREHFAACYNFHTTITHIAVCHSHKYRFTFDDRTGDVIDYLPDFKHLVDLSIYNDLDENLTIFDIQALRPNLKNLSFASSFPIHDDYVDATIDEISAHQHSHNY